MPDENRSITISNGTFIKSAIAGGDVKQTINEGSRHSRAAELRTELRRHRDELIRLAGTKGSGVAHNLDEIDAQLASPKPDPDIVRGGWKSVARIVTGAGSAAESFSKIAELVHSLFGA